jgi:hypothetical protein
MDEPRLSGGSKSDLAIDGSTCRNLGPVVNDYRDNPAEGEKSSRFVNVKMKAYEFKVVTGGGKASGVEGYPAIQMLAKRDIAAGEVMTSLQSSPHLTSSHLIAMAIGTALVLRQVPLPRRGRRLSQERSLPMQRRAKPVGKSRKIPGYMSMFIHSFIQIHFVIHFLGAAG